MSRASFRRHADHEAPQVARRRLQAIKTAKGDHAIALCRELLQQRIEWHNEFFDAFVFELGGDQIEPHTELRELVHDPSGVRHTLLDRVLHPTMVAEDRDRLCRHGVDGQRPDQRLDVHQIGIGRILRARAGP